jgi:DnaK suppressor protein
MLSKTFLKKMKENLLSQRQFLIRQTSEDQHVHIDTDGDEFDEIQGNLLIEIHNQLNSRNNDKLDRIENALQQMNSNTYGVCEDCGELIPEKRLMINPYTPICVCCAEDREIEKNKGGKFNLEYYNY